MGTGGPVGGWCRAQVRRKVRSGAVAVEMNRKVEFRNILVELIELADKLNAGYGGKESSKRLLGFWLEQPNGWMVVFMAY